MSMQKGAGPGDEDKQVQRAASMTLKNMERRLWFKHWVTWSSHRGSVVNESD